MSPEFTYAVVFSLIVVHAMVNVTVLAQSFVAEVYKNNGIVPDVISEAPKYGVEAYYPHGVWVNLGNELTPIQTKDIPIVEYNAAFEFFYTLAMIANSAMSAVARAFADHDLVADMIPIPPVFKAEVIFPSGVEAHLGNELTPTQVKDMPKVSWKTLPDTFYTLVMSDPDAPSRTNSQMREWQHWLVGNIPGDNIAAGETLTEFVSSGPLLTTGIHRYVFLVYKQSGMINFDEPRLTNTSPDHRSHFCTAKFAKKYDLGNPVAGNFYQAQYDDYVPIVFMKLGLDPASVL